jgi:hypothetical protein
MHAGQMIKTLVGLTPTPLCLRVVLLLCSVSVRITLRSIYMISPICLKLYNNCAKIIFQLAVLVLMAHQGSTLGTQAYIINIEPMGKYSVYQTSH